MNTTPTNLCKNTGRRKVLKTIIGGTAAAFAYNLLPAKWSAPVIESVFVPAHAALSGANGGKNSNMPNTNTRSIAGKWKNFYDQAGDEFYQILECSDTECTAIQVVSGTTSGGDSYLNKDKKGDTLSYSISGNSIQFKRQDGEMMLSGILSKDGKTIKGRDVYGDGKGESITMIKM